MISQINDVNNLSYQASIIMVANIYDIENLSCPEDLLDLLEIHQNDDKKNIRSIETKDLKWQRCNAQICKIKNLYQRFMTREIYGFGHTQRKYECKDNDNISVHMIKILEQLNVYGVFLHDTHTVMWLRHVLDANSLSVTRTAIHMLVARVKYVSYG